MRALHSAPSTHNPHSPNRKVKMSSRFLKHSRARAVALAVGAVTLGSLASAPAVFAKGVSQQSPTVGNACATDGKISGTGSTFQANALVDAYIVGYMEDVCGPVNNATNMNPNYDTV